MLTRILLGVRHQYRLARALVREEAERERHKEWEKISKLHLFFNSRCAACGGNTHLMVHRIDPDPKLALSHLNFITLCFGGDECAFRIGRGSSWNHSNPHVVENAAEALKYPERRRAIELRAEAASHLSGRKK